ncbi:hypothetical protein AM2010_1301 [Pelagerythrobacter marensis]|uniref:Uncharacterized protein n=1 Tax=Pelagerythrobacter marensis TaxID=543877 RepID=A0A0G3X9T3_9SPHN|nr:hypothetical protein AM2010_1301 [Pelagerythrobacter marensis]
MIGVTQMLPHWGSWQRVALTEGAFQAYTPSTTTLRVAVPLPQKGRTMRICSHFVLDFCNLFGYIPKSVFGSRR